MAEIKYYGPIDELPKGWQSEAYQCVMIDEHGRIYVGVRGRPDASLIFDNTKDARALAEMLIQAANQVDGVGVNEGERCKSATR